MNICITITIKEFEKKKYDVDFDTWLENQPEGTFVQGGGIDIPKTLNDKETVDNLKFVCSVFERALNNALGIDHAYTNAFENAKQEILNERETHDNKAGVSERLEKK